MWKIGDTIICYSKNEEWDLTLGREYKIMDIFVSKYNTWIWVQNDTNHVERYPSTTFNQKIEVKTSDLPPGTTAKVLSNKPHLAYFDPHLEYEMGLGMRKGAEKHGWNNHRNLTDEAAQQIVDSVKRHLNAYLREEQIDPELQINHLACVVNNINFLYRLDRKFGYEAVLNSIYGITK